MSESAWLDYLNAAFAEAARIKGEPAPKPITPDEWNRPPRLLIDDNGWGEQRAEERAYDRAIAAERRDDRRW